MDDVTNVENARAMQTRQMAVLDSQEFLDGAVKVSKTINGGIPGTNKAYDANKVSSDLVNMVFEELKDPSGVHVETALATLGALAGFSGQMAIREEFIKSGKISEDKTFLVVKTKSGDSYYFGDSLNEILFGTRPGIISIYGLVGGAAHQSGAGELLEVKDLARYVAGTVGNPAFGIPRLPAQHMPKNPPIDLLDKYWNPVRNFLVVNVRSPSQWPLVMGTSAMKVIIMSKNVINPALAAQIVMESAVPMAHVDPGRIHFAYFKSY